MKKTTWCGHQNQATCQKKNMTRTKSQILKENLI